MFMLETIEGIVKVHPIWSTLTFAIIFAPGLVFGINALLALCGNRTRMFDEIQNKKDLSIGFRWCLLYALIFLLSFCFPVGVIMSRIFEIFIACFGTQGMVSSMEFRTEIATGFEAFLESAPQIILRLYIICSTDSSLISGT